MLKTEMNSVATYNLSSVGRALHSRVQARRESQKRTSATRNKGKAETENERIEVIQDLNFPTACARVKSSADGESLLATGSYPPQLKVFELRELSLKFSHHFTSDVVQFQCLDTDWKKLVFLLADRTVEFHTQFGKHHTTRIPHFGRAMAYQPETTELLVAGAGEEIFRLSLERGCFLKPLATGLLGVNVLGVSPAHGMLAAGSSDGIVQLWDPRQRNVLGLCSPFDALAAHGEHLEDDSAREVTALRFDERGLRLAVGTSSGHVALYDIRRATPLSIKDQGYGQPMVDLKFLSDKYLLSADSKIIKVWDANSSSATNFTSIEPNAHVNDVCVCKGSGLIFAALESERLGAYFIPALGPAPRWCHFLDALTEEMEENGTPTVYDDYKFVTREELEELNLGSLVGTKVLRPYMHGFFLDVRLHAKALSLSQPFAYETWRKERLQQKLDAKTAGRIAPVKRAKLPKVNPLLAQELHKSATASSALGRGADGDAGVSAPPSLLDDARFAQLFTDPEYQIDEASEEYTARRPHLRRSAESSNASGGRESAVLTDDSEDEEAEEGSGGEEPETDEELPAGGGGDRREKSRSGSSGRPMRVLGVDDDLLAGAGGRPGSAPLPRSSSFGARLAQLPDAHGGRAINCPSELTFHVAAGQAARQSELRSGGRGRGLGGARGKSGQGLEGNGEVTASAMKGKHGNERRSMLSGMLSRAKGKGKGKGRGRGGGRGIAKRGGGHGGKGRSSRR